MPFFNDEMTMTMDDDDQEWLMSGHNHNYMYPDGKGRYRMVLEWYRCIGRNKQEEEATAYSEQQQLPEPPKLAR